MALVAAAGTAAAYVSDMSKNEYKARIVKAGGNFSRDAIAIYRNNTHIAVGHAYTWEDADIVIAELTKDGSHYVTVEPLTKAVRKAAR